MNYTMNKHTATDEVTGQVFTRNSATKIYSHAVVTYFILKDGTVECTSKFATWASRLDLAQKEKAATERYYAKAHLSDEIARVEVRILEAEVK